PTVPSTSMRPRSTGLSRTTAYFSGTGMSSPATSARSGSLRTFQPPSSPCSIASSAVKVSGRTVPSRCQASSRAETNAACPLVMSISCAMGPGSFQVEAGASWCARPGRGWSQEGGCGDVGDERPVGLADAHDDAVEPGVRAGDDLHGLALGDDDRLHVVPVAADRLVAGDLTVRDDLLALGGLEVVARVAVLDGLGAHGPVPLWWCCPYS